MSESERRTKENVTLRGILIAVGVLVIGVLLWYAHRHIPEPVSVLLKTLAETLLIAGFVGILYDLFLRRSFKIEMAIMVSKAINANVDFLREKMGGEVDSIIESCLEAKLCNNKMAKMFFKGLIFPYLDIEKYRRKFDYEIKFQKLDSDLEVNSVMLRKDLYFKVTEELTYTKHLLIKKDTDFVVGLCLDDKQLEYYKDDDCVYRTIFRINESERIALHTYPLPETIFKITICINDNELMQNMTTYDNERGIKINCKYTGMEISVEEKAEFKISIAMLHTKSKNYYTAYLYDPSHNPNIKLHYIDEMSNIFATTHFTTSERKDIKPEPNNDAKHIRVEAKNVWVFPTSGVVFIWTPR
jgi:hypothetical protein